jgi:catechol 2,3-dioxygenase-like lactoylglutathione lyase family enzyme
LALPFGIDHAVIAVRDLDAAATTFRELGFTLTPRGHHSIGSQNHCIMLGSTYIELLAPMGMHPWLEHYREFLRSGDGLAAIALRTDDADAAYQALREKGVAAAPPMDLSRPVDGGVARFRLVRIDDVPNVFVCQHQTPELVWRSEWQRHASGASELVGVALAAEQPFAGLPLNVDWQATPALRIHGLCASAEAHGVRLTPA